MPEETGKASAKFCKKRLQSQRSVEAVQPKIHLDKLFALIVVIGHSCQEGGGVLRRHRRSFHCELECLVKNLAVA